MLGIIPAIFGLAQLITHFANQQRLFETRQKNIQSEGMTNVLLQNLAELEAGRRTATDALVQKDLGFLRALAEGVLSRGPGGAEAEARIISGQDMGADFDRALAASQAALEAAASNLRPFIAEVERLGVAADTSEEKLFLFVENFDALIQRYTAALRGMTAGPALPPFDVTASSKN